jgi:hypothetical protein
MGSGGVRNVAALADSPRIERFDVRMLAPAEAKQLLAAAEDDRYGNVAMLTIFSRVLANWLLACGSG